MEKKKIKLSIALAVFNESKNLRKCLDSIKDIVTELVIVDGGSTDSSVEIAKEYNAKIIQTDNPKIFHINKQKALDACTGTWILQLDADEVIPEDLKNEIILTINNESSPFNGYFIPRSNYFWGHFMKKGGQYPDSVIRLIRNGYAIFPCKSVHEQIAVTGQVGTLLHPMLHYTYLRREDYWKKANTYTSLTALELKKTYGTSLGSIIILLALYGIIKPFFTFLSLYIRHKGFVDGLTGFEFSLYSALHFPWAYIKYIRNI